MLLQSRYQSRPELINQQDIVHPNYGNTKNANELIASNIKLGKSEGMNYLGRGSSLGLGMEYGSTGNIKESLTRSIQEGTIYDPSSSLVFKPQVVLGTSPVPFPNLTSPSRISSLTVPSGQSLSQFSGGLNLLSFSNKPLQPLTNPSSNPLGGPLLRPSLVQPSNPLGGPLLRPSLVQPSNPLTVPLLRPSLVQPLTTVPLLRPSLVQPLTTVPLLRPSLVQPLTTVPLLRPSLVQPSNPLTVPLFKPLTNPLTVPLSRPSLVQSPSPFNIVTSPVQTYIAPVQSPSPFNIVTSPVQSLSRTGLLAPSGSSFSITETRTRQPSIFKIDSPPRQISGTVTSQLNPPTVSVVLPPSDLRRPAIVTNPQLIRPTTLAQNMVSGM